MARLGLFLWALIPAAGWFLLAAPHRASAGTVWQVVAHYVSVVVLVPIVVWWLTLAPWHPAGAPSRTVVPAARALMQTMILVQVGLGLPLGPLGPGMALIPCFVWWTDMAEGILRDAYQLPAQEDAKEPTQAHERGTATPSGEITTPFMRSVTLLFIPFHVYMGSLAGGFRSMPRLREHGHLVMLALQVALALRAHGRAFARLGDVGQAHAIVAAFETHAARAKPSSTPPERPRVTMQRYSRGSLGATDSRLRPTAARRVRRR